MLHLHVTGVLPMIGGRVCAQLQSTHAAFVNHARGFTHRTNSEAHVE
jgi:hypothetical protein